MTTQLDCIATDGCKATVETAVVDHRSFLLDAADRASSQEIAQARLRLAMKCLSAAAEADPKLYVADAWRLALTHVAALLGETAKLSRRTQ